MTLLTLDHLALSCSDLVQGAAHIEARLGMPIGPGGKHDLMGTHNRLFGMQNDLYFEVIAIDPDAPAPKRPRWFNLDAFQGAPRMTNWIFRTPDLAAALDALPDGFGTPLSFQRGDLKWQMAVPDDGVLPWDGWAPAIIEWEGDKHPMQNLPIANVTLETLTLKHPDAEAIAAALAPHMAPDTALFEVAETPALEAQVRTFLGNSVTLR